jgi:hypothetical protein
MFVQLLANRFKFSQISLYLLAAVKLSQESRCTLCLYFGMTVYASRPYLYVLYIDMYLEFVLITIVSKLGLSWELGQGKPMSIVLDASTEPVYKGARPSECQ